MLETVLNSIKTLKILCKITSNVFFNKKIYDDNKKNIIYMINFRVKSKFYY